MARKKKIHNGAGNAGSVSEQGSLTGENNPVVEQALGYLHRGFSVIPLSPMSKIPPKGFEWARYQKGPASEDDVRQWFTGWPDANLGIVTGAVSGIVVVDCDNKDAARELKRIMPELKTVPRVKTSKGHHFFFRHPGYPVPNSASVFFPKMDVRGDGGFVVAPPSIHERGHQYEWQVPINGELPQLPEEISSAATRTKTETAKDKRFDSSVVWEGLPQGQRDDQMFRYACQLRSLNAPREVAERLILEAWSRCRQGKKPFTQDNALAKLDQAWKYPSGNTDQGNRDPVLEQVSEIDREDVSWLGHHRVPRGKITMVEGDPGQGKSFLTQALAAAVSRGCCFPGDEQKTPESVIIMSAEDGANDTIRPRLEDMQADLGRIVLLRGMRDEKGNESHITLADLDVIEKALREVGPVLLIIDPLIAYTANKDTHKASEVRSLLAPLAGLAEKHEVAVVCVRHLNKGSGKFNYRGQGSIDFLAACRSAFLCGPDPENNQLKAFVHIKSNVGPIMPTLTYSIENGMFTWIGEADITAEQVLDEGLSGDEKSRLAEAKDFLIAKLSGGEAPVPEIEKESKQLGLSWHTVKRAKRVLRVRHIKPIGASENSPWYWRLSS
jgi:archaellum biogenesis ATPase FlaH